MNKIFRFGAAFAVLALTGAGCFGGSSTAINTGGVWQSSDSGKIWTATSAVPTATGTSSLEEVDVTTFAIDPQDTSAIYAGTLANGMFYSLDSGASWQRPEEALARAGAVVAIAVSSVDVCTYFVAKTDRVMKTTDCGRTFTTGSYIESQAKVTIAAMSLDWYDSNTVWIGTTAGDVIRSVDGGGSWSTVTRTDTAVTSLAISGADSRIVFVGTKTSGMVRTIDGGVTWVSYEDILNKDYKSSDRVFGFAQNANGTVAVMNTQYGLLVSKDKGSTWTPMSLISASGEVRIYSVAISPSNGDVIYYGTAAAVNRSTSGGGAWTTSELPSTRAAMALLVDPENDAHVYLGSANIASK